MGEECSTPIARLLLPHISPAGEGPLYRQIVNAIRREISSGRLPPGTAMPSFRQLARDLLVSLITVKRAYEELEREGLINMRQGLGTFVANEGASLSREVKTDEAKRLIARAVKEAREAGLSDVRIRALVREILQSGDD